MQPEPYDAIVIGSGFGGAMAAHVLVEAGWSVLMLERGDWVARGRHNWTPDEVGPLTTHYSTESPYHLSGPARNAMMRHYNEIVFGIFPRPPNPGGGFHKQLAIHDFYFGDPSVRRFRGKLGGIQQLATPPVALVRAELPRLLGAACTPWVSRMTGLLAIAEDQPNYEKPGDSR